MMQLATWISVAILGPGAVAVFTWFLVDMARSVRSTGTNRSGGDGGPRSS